MFKMTTAIYNALKKDGDLKVFTEEYEKSSEVWLQFGIKNGGSYRIKFISRDDDNDVAVRVFGIISVEEDQKEKLLPALNELNNKYRFMKFVLDDDGDVNMEYDYPLRDPDPAASAQEMVIRIVKMVDDAYPLLMRRLWS